MSKIYCKSGCNQIMRKNKQFTSGHNMRFYSRCKPIDEKFFDKIGEDQAYLLGYLFADGCMRKQRKKSFVVSFSTIDKQLFLDIRKKLKADKSGFRRKRNNECKPIYTFSTANKKITQRLLSLGLIRKKAKRLVYPSFLPKELFFHFLRGFFDGDGCVHISYNKEKKPWTCHVIISSLSSNFLRKFQKLLRSFFIDSTITKNSIFNLNIRKYESVLRLYKNLYYNTDFYLSRKKKIFSSFFSSYIPSISNGKCTKDFKKRLSVIQKKLRSSPGVRKKYRIASKLAYQNPLLRKKLGLAIKKALKKPENYKRLLQRTNKIGKLKTKKRFKFLNSQINDIALTYLKTHSIRKTEKKFHCSGKTVCILLDANNIEREKYKSKNYAKESPNGIL